MVVSACRVYVFVRPILAYCRVDCSDVEKRPPRRPKEIGGVRRDSTAQTVDDPTAERVHVHEHHLTTGACTSPTNST